MSNVLPRDVLVEKDGPLDDPFSGFFGKFEMETVAYLIVMLLSRQNEWRYVTFSEIHAVGEEMEEDPSNVISGWEDLLDNGWLVQCSDRLSGFEVTPNFIKRCKEMSLEKTSGKPKGTLPLDVLVEPAQTSGIRFAGFFGMHEMDLLAYFIVKNLSVKNRWGRVFFADLLKMAKDETDRMYIQLGWNAFEETPWLVQHKTLRDCVTVSEEFIQQCKKMSDQVKKREAEKA
jgi:hypothetical protein